MSHGDYVVYVAAQCAKWLLMIAVATAGGIRLWEWWQQQRKAG